MKNPTKFILEAAALMLVVMATGCTGQIDTSDSDADEPGYAPSARLAGDQCFVDVWVTATAACVCPPLGTGDYTLECQAADCLQSDILALNDQNEARRVLVRYSALEGRLSAAAPGPIEGAWKAGDGYLRLAFDNTDTITPTECAGTEIVQGKITMTAAEPGLAKAIWWSWEYDHWLDTPYQP
jgi:hypothetical protein